MVAIPGLPALSWIADDAPASQVDGALVMSAGPRTDWFNDPAGPTRLSSAPALVFAVDGDMQLSATVTVDFSSMFDAGVLFVHQTDDDWAKLCFEQAPSGDVMAVSVVTRQVSDDCNGPVIAGNSVRLRISKMGGVIAFHHALVDDPTETWHMTRLFALRSPDLPMRMGVLVQSPTGEGCTATFSNVQVVRETLREPRNGS